MVGISEEGLEEVVPYPLRENPSCPRSAAEARRSSRNGTSAGTESVTWIAAATTRGVA